MVVLARMDLLPLWKESPPIGFLYVCCTRVWKDPRSQEVQDKINGLYDLSVIRPNQERRNVAEEGRNDDT